MTSFYSQTLDEYVSPPKIMSSLNIKNTADDFAASLSDSEEIVFQNIWDRFNLPIRKFIYDMCGSYELAEELAQETFVRVFKGLKSFRRENKFSSWIFGIAKNVVLENMRQRKKNSRYVEIEHAEFFTVPEEKSSPEHSVIEAEMFTAIHRALEKFEPEQRISFVLRVFHNKSYVEIAEITGFGISKIKVDIFRIRTKLRKKLSCYLEKSDEL